MNTTTHTYTQIAVSNKVQNPFFILQQKEISLEITFGRCSWMMFVFAAQMLQINHSLDIHEQLPSSNSTYIKKRFRELSRENKYINLKYYMKPICLHENPKIFLLFLFFAFLLSFFFSRVTTKAGVQLILINSQRKKRQRKREKREFYF